MNGVMIARKANVALTADQWQLYTTNRDCRNAATQINEAIENAFNLGLSRREVEAAALQVMEEWAAFGATDTEPRDVLDDILDELFPRKEAW